MNYTLILKLGEYVIIKSLLCRSLLQLNYMKKILLLLLILFSIAIHAIAQDFPYDAVTDGEMNMKKYDKDTSAHAVVLQEFGKSRIDVARDDNIKVLYEYHVKIKIFDDKGFDNGTVKIALYNNSDNDSYEQVKEITGVTYFKDDNGATQKIELETKNIYPEKESKHWAYYKFAMPGLRKGCVIEFKYQIESPYLGNFQPWNFQSEIPKVYSEYEVHIPAFWVYNVSLKGNLKLTKNTSSVERNCFSLGGGGGFGHEGMSCDCSEIIYGMGDIPAFIDEDYMTSSKNFTSAINFELSEYTDFNNGQKIKYTKSWPDIDHLLKTDDGFGVQLKKKGLFKDRIVPVIAEKTDDLGKAKAVYAYIQKSFKWDGRNGVQSLDGLNKALTTHTGNAADINLSLVNALTAAGLNTETVLLSTRDNGTLNPLYPAINGFNYVVAKVNIGDQSYLLDATDPLLPFGMLPLRCLNDKGRVFNLDKPSYWIDLNLSQKEKNTYALDFTLQDDGKLKGTLVHSSFGYEAYEKRVAIKKFNTIDEYLENLNAASSKVKVLKSEITNLDSLDLPLQEKYELEITVYNKLEDRLSFNPFFWNRMDTNPFKLAERSYPVDKGMSSDERFILTIHLPEQYIIEAPPQTLAMAMPNNGGKFLTNYATDNNIITFSYVIQFNKSIYSTEEYPYLKELYNKIIQSEKAEMVFKKK